MPIVQGNYSILLYTQRKSLRIPSELLKFVAELQQIVVIYTTTTPCVVDMDTYGLKFSEVVQASLKE